MSAQAVVIPGFPSTNRVPGAYGQVTNSSGAQTAASLPKKVLCVGLKGTAGTIGADTQVAPILSQTDADTYAGAGSEGACMLYDALVYAAVAGVPLYYASPLPPAGATAATTNFKITGTATSGGSVTVRINGTNVTQGIAIGDTGAVVAANLANSINGLLSGRAPISATSGTNYVTLACKTAGQRGMQHVVFLDVTQIAPGITATSSVTWAPSTVWAVGDQVIPKTAPAGLYFKVTTAGTGGASEPVSWPTTIGTTVTDGAATLTCWGSTATGTSPTTAVFLGNGSGLESYTNLLTGPITSQFFDRIAIAANDSASLAVWKTQIDQGAAAPTNFLSHVDVSSNGTMTAAQSLAQTTLNDTRFQFLWTQNCETHPSRESAAMATVRAQAEQSNPNAEYDGLVLQTVAAQSQLADWPTLPVRIAAINNSLTVVSSWRGDGYATVERSITTKSLTGGFADYSTIDTGMQSTADFILTDGKLYYSNVLQKNNPVVRDDPPPGGDKIPAGVLTPSMAVSSYVAKLKKYANGNLSSNPKVGSASIPPIILAPLPGDVSAAFDPIAQRIMISIVARVMPINHQLGISVQQSQ